MVTGFIVNRYRSDSTCEIASSKAFLPGEGKFPSMEEEVQYGMEFPTSAPVYEDLQQSYFNGLRVELILVYTPGRYSMMGLNEETGRGFESRAGARSRKGPWRRTENIVSPR